MEIEKRSGVETKKKIEIETATKASTKANLTGDIDLVERVELVPAKGLFGQVVVFEAEADNGFAARLRDEGVEVVDVQFGFEQGGHEPAEFRRVDFHHHEFAFGERETMLDQQVPGTVGVVDDKADDGAVGSIQDHESEDVNAVGAEEANEIVETAQAIGGKNGELNDGVAPGRLGSFNGHMPNSI